MTHYGSPSFSNFKCCFGKGLLMFTRFCFIRTLLFAVLAPCAVVVPAQHPTRRLLSMPATTESRVALNGGATGHHARAEAMGDLPGETALTAMSLVLKPTAQQDADLTQLLSDQQNPSSPSYHKWLTPAQFGNRFGVADADIALLQSWLQSRGFLVQSVADSRNRIVFTGTASAVEAAFRVHMQWYRRSGKAFFENSDSIQLPASLATVVGSVDGLSSYRLATPQASRAVTADATVSPQYTTATSGHYLVPWDLRQIYGSNTLIGSGYDGTGIKIGIIGQSAVDTTQLTYFQQKTGQTVTLPTMVLVPNTGVSNRVEFDEGESELDLEYASGNAPGASVQFIYTGCTATTSSSVLSATTNCNTNGVFDALTYAVTKNLAPILSLSYGGCEEENAVYANSTLEPVLRQANAQGQTIMVSSGDSGAASCESSASPTVATGGLTVSYPASSLYVTGIGGTTLPASDDASTYWSSTNNTYLGSAIGYMPEVAWNDTASRRNKDFTSSGGGVSKLFGKPSWQAGTGVPADNHRDVPDVSFPANVQEHAYLVCDATAPCTSGTKSFTPGATTDGGAVGGTSAAAPTFAGMLAIVEQANGGRALGNINPSLYALAAGTAGSSIFHDITSGTNIVSCTVGTLDCTTGTLGYSTTAGYDLVTGLGSIAIPALRTALQAATVTSSNTATTSLSASTTTPLTNAAVTFNVAATGANGTPSGTVMFAVDGAVSGSAVALTSGLATYTLTGGFTTAGAHTVVATYSGDGTYAPASSTLSLTASSSSSTFSLSSSPATLTISAGGSGTEAITVTSSGFTGSLSFRGTLLSSTSSTFPYCLSLNPSTLSLAANATQTATLTINTASTCSSAGSIPISNSTVPTPQTQTLPRTGLLVLSAGVLGCFALRRRVPRSLLSLIGASLLAFGLAGCGSGTSTSTGSTTTTPTPTPTTTTSTNSSVTTGTYSLRITAVSLSNASITGSTTFTLIVQ